MQLSAGKAITKIHSSDAQEEDGGRRGQLGHSVLHLLVMGAYCPSSMVRLYRIPEKRRLNTTRF
jgi:hypothetical protein